MTPLTLDRELVWLVSGVAGALALSTSVGLYLERGVTTPAARATIANMNARIRAWWLMCAAFSAAMLTGGIGSTVFFGLLSALALREFVTLLPTRRGDHGALLWAFFALTPLQYWLVAAGWERLFALFIPLGAPLLLAARNAVAGDCEGFVERTAGLQLGLLLCVYCPSHLPALLLLPLPGGPQASAKLVVFLVVVVEMSDVLQYVWGKWCGRRAIAPIVSPGKTWEGFLGGVGSATLLGAGLWWLTPFAPWQAAGLALLLALAGFGGGLALSAIKRERGVKDFGGLIDGHGGVLDRIDSLCFAAPLFFHVVRYLLAWP